MKNKLISISRGEKYDKKVINILKRSKKKICYVTLNKTRGYLIDIFKKSKINIKKVHFIEGVTGFITKPKKVIAYDILKHPLNLRKISSLVKKTIKQGYKIVIFDSLTDMLIYEKTTIKELALFMKPIVELLGEVDGELIVFYDKSYKGEISNSEILSFFNEFSSS